MRWRDKFKDEDGNPVTIEFKDEGRIKTLINKLKNRLITN